MRNNKIIPFKTKPETIKDFMKEMITNPARKIESVGTYTARYTKIAVAIFVIWIAAEFMQFFLFHVLFASLSDFIMNPVIMQTIIMSSLAPAITIIATALGVYLFFRRDVGQPQFLLTTIVVANVPTALGAVLSLLPTLIGIFTPLGLTLSIIITSINGILRLISMLLLYFGLKAFLEENDNERFFLGFIKIQIVYFVLGLLPLIFDFPGI